MFKFLVEVEQKLGWWIMKSYMMGWFVVHFTFEEGNKMQLT
jgi:hypothetical protein